MSGIPQVSVLGVTLFDTFFGDMESRTVWNLSKFANGTRLCVAGDTLEGRDSILRDLDRLEVWLCVILMKFNKDNGKVLHLGQDNPSVEWGEN